MFVAFGELGTTVHVKPSRLVTMPYALPTNIAPVALRYV
jgi:hypothetical protein